jgi:hypothetical protein
MPDPMVCLTEDPGDESDGEADTAIFKDMTYTSRERGGYRTDTMRFLLRKDTWYRRPLNKGANPNCVG